MRKITKSKPCTKSLLLIVALFSLSGFSNIQANTEVKDEKTTNQASQTIKGKVVDSSGEPLIGVSVSVLNSTTGVITDIDGQYILTVPSGTTQIKFSYIGFKDQIVSIKGQSSINIVMEENATMLKEVVAVGYGTQKKETLTGAISTISSDVLKDKGTTTNLLQALQGTTPGLFISRSSSAPGRNGWDIKIRGESSLNGQEPLLVIDGVPYPSLSAMDMINNDDIESMSVLKDGSAAIYGARGSGGVILVTTKKGKKGEPTIDYKGSYTFKKRAMLDGIRLANMSQWAEMYIEAYKNDGQNVWDDPNNPNPNGKIGNIRRGIWDKFLNPSLRPSEGWEYDNVDGRFYTYDDTSDYVDFMWGNAWSTNHDIRISGGTDKTNYMFSLGYLKDESPLKVADDAYQRYNARTKIGTDITSWLNLNLDLSYSMQKKVKPAANVMPTTGYPFPGYPIYTKEGKPYSGWMSWVPWAPLMYGGKQKENINYFTSVFQIDIQPIKDWHIIGSAAYNSENSQLKYYTQAYELYRPDEVSAGYGISPSNTEVKNESTDKPYQSYQLYTSYKKTIKEDHKFGVMLGTSYEKDQYKWWQARGFGLQFDDLHVLGQASSKITINETIEDVALASYYGRLNYSFRDKYLLEGQMRHDGSSKFSDGHRWASFYGGSLGWIISEESFIKQLNIFDFLKFRASYGEAGNQSGIGKYDYYSLINLNQPSGNADSKPMFGPDSAPYVGSSMTFKNMVSLDRTWETVATTNFGLDFTVLNSRLSGTLEWFKRDNKNMLIDVTYPQVLGSSAPKTNNGRLETKGWEVSLNWRDKIGNVTYFVGGNLSDAKAVLKEYDGASAISRNYNLTIEGKPIGAIYGYEYTGRIQNKEQLDDYKNNVFYEKTANNGLPGLLTLGDNTYKDQNGDGILDNKDLIYIGDNQLHYTYGINLGAEWNGFDFSVFFQGVGKYNRFLNQHRNYNVPFGVAWDGQKEIFYHQTWAEDRTNAPLPRLTVNYDVRNYNYDVSTFSVRDGRYIRLKNLVLGYTIPKLLTHKAKIEKVRVYFSGQDLWESVANNYSKFDPEAGGVRNKDINWGDLSSDAKYPFMRGFTFGIDVTF